MVKHLKKHFKKYIAGVVASTGIATGVHYKVPDVVTNLVKPGVSSTCHAVSYQGATLPDPTCTPGFTNPDISQQNISQNICNPKWSTKTIRPPVSYTTPLKVKQLQEYDFSDKATKSYEEDHLISLELGGSPTDPSNLWPEPYAPAPGAHEKDSVENYLHKQVCAGKITLEEAQKEVSTNWYDVYLQINNNSDSSDN